MACLKLELVVNKVTWVFRFVAAWWDGEEVGPSNTVVIQIIKFEVLYQIEVAFQKEGRSEESDGVRQNDGVNYYDHVITTSSRFRTRMWGTRTMCHLLLWRHHDVSAS